MSISDYFLLIMSVDELGPPATEAGQQPPGTQPGLGATSTPAHLIFTKPWFYQSSSVPHLEFTRGSVNNRKEAE
jgi:hypothetical protein